MSDSKEKIIDELKIRIDRDTCIGTGNCIKIAPEVFEFDDERIVSFKEETGSIERDCLIEACMICPVSALGVFKFDGEQLVP